MFRRHNLTSRSAQSISNLVERGLGDRPMRLWSADWRSAWASSMILKTGWSPTGFSLLVLALDQVLTLLAFDLAFVLLLPRQVPRVLPETWYLAVLPFFYEPGYVALFVVGWLLATFGCVVFGAYRNAYHTSVGYQGRQAMKGILLAMMTAGAGLFVFRPAGIEPDLLMSFTGFQLLLIPLFKLAIGDLRLFLKSRDVGRVRTILAGSAEDIASLYERIEREMHDNYRVVAVITEEPGALPETIRALPVILSAAAGAAIERFQPHHLLIREPAPSGPLIDELARHCRAHDVVLRMVPARQKVTIGESRVHDLLGIPLVLPHPPAQAGLRYLLKRGIDILGAGVLLLCLAPMLLVVAILIRLDSPGPLFYLQTRLTRGRRPFRIIKFRSMYVDADRRLAELQARNEATGPIFKMRDDPRVTRVGKWIRKLSIDEIPQFFNVIAGHISLVGPRPPIPAEVEKYEPWQLGRLEVLSGISGLWQVSGRSTIDFEEMVLLDLYYIENWSLLLDIEILLDTLPTVLTGRGAF